MGRPHPDRAHARGLGEGATNRAILIYVWYTISVFAVGIPAAVLLVRGMRGMKRRDSPPVSAIEGASLEAAIGLVLALATIALALAESSLELGLAFAILSSAYIAYCLPGASRRYGYRSAVVVRCQPQDAFALIGDARNWPRYFPELKVVEPVEVPLRQGSVIHVTLDMSGITASGDEVVVEYDPARRFATATPGEDGVGAYEFAAVDGGTEIAYVYTGTLRFRHALLGNAVRRRSLVRKMKARRDVAMRAIKAILESEPAVPV